MTSTTNFNLNECTDTIRHSGMFASCSPETLEAVCSRMKRVTYPKGAVMYRQNEQQESMSVVAQGKVERLIEINEQMHTLDVRTPGSAIGSHHLLAQDPSSAVCKCLTPVVAFTMDRPSLEGLIEKPSYAKEIICSLNREIRRQANLLQTPLLEQHAKPTPYFAASVAAAIESFYRSALNAFLNARLTGQPPASLFPNMGVQIPTRVVYINGFKGIRHIMEKNIDADTYSNPGAVRILEAVTPGVIMTPVSSILEACNAGHVNPESLYTRWIRGLIPRGIREVIFGVGLNQLSDYFEERVPIESSPALKNAAGSLLAGCVAGYFSHVPHNLSTLKLMNPQKSYKAHLTDLIKHSESRVPKTYSAGSRFALASLLAVVFPRGLTIRTTQIVGSFIILNGTINSLKDFDPVLFSKNLLNN